MTKGRIEVGGESYRRGVWAVAMVGALATGGCQKASSPPTATSTEPATSGAAAPPAEVTQGPGLEATGRAFPEVQATALAASPPADSTLRWLAVSGGADPFSTELQIETDALAAVMFLEAAYPAKGLVLFGGGAGTYGIHEQPPEDVGGEIPLVEVIGEIFGGRGRPVNYRVNRVPAHGAAETDVFLDLLEAASKAPGDDLTVWLSGHGEPAAGPDDAAHVVWGGDFISPQLISEATASASRDVRFLAAMCHAGGFTALGMHPQAEADDGRAVRCVLAATTWDRVASGCDPDPDRQERESYARHLIEALSGKTVDGQSLPMESRDTDGDGLVSWFEAHTHAAVVSRGFDVPITTSQRWAIEKSDGGVGAGDASETWTWTEVDGAVAQLRDRLALDSAPDPGAAVDAKLLILKGRIDDARAAMDEAAGVESVELARLRGALLARWAVLDDPWHPAFLATLRVNAEAIAAFLRDSQLYATWQAAADRVAGLDAAASELEVAIAPWLRMKLFLDANAGGKSLMRRAPDDPARRHFEALLRCERGIPGPPKPLSNP